MAGPIIEEGEVDQSLVAYWLLLKEYPGWRVLWFGEIASNLGNWFGLVATLLVVESLAEGQGLLLSVVVIMRFMPAFILFPIAGVCADRNDRVKVLIIASLVSAGAVVLLPVVQRPQELWLLYALLFVEFSMAAFYDPARRALTPSLVPRSKLHLATTLDSFAWSLVGALGSSLGGLAASKVGVYACFGIDAVTYILAAGCAYKLQSMQRKVAKGLLPDEAGGDDEAERGLLKPQSDTLPGAGSTGAEVELQSQADHLRPAIGSLPCISEPLSSQQNGLAGSAPLGLEAESKEDAAVVRQGSQQVSSGLVSGSEHHQHGRVGQPPTTGCCALILWSLRDETLALREGWRYVWHRSNRDVLALTLLKASGSLVWAAADVLNVRFSELPEMQGLGDSAFTLGLFFASVGAACFVGPIVFNWITPPKPPNLLLSSAVCFLFLVAGYLGIAASGNVYTMCGSIMVRSFGSAVMWVYSTLLIQLRVPDDLLGRMLALEMAFLTVAECASGLFGGVALDDLGLNVRQTGLILAGVGAGMAAIWLPYAISNYRRAVKAMPPAAPL